MTTLYTKPTFMVGSDPEFAIRSVVDGTLQSALDYVDGTKEDPFKLNNGDIQADGTSVEFNSQPADTVQLFVLNHNLILNEVADYLALKGLLLDKNVSSIEATHEMLLNPLASVGGCSIDYNAWRNGGFAVNPKPFYDLTNVRAMGGHLHISTNLCDDDNEYENRIKIIKALDLVLGVPSVIMDTNGSARRKFYGKAGAVRYKSKGDGSYNGVEYRVLSNFWLQTDELMAWAFNGVKHVIENLEELSDLAISIKADIIKAINKDDKSLAERIINDNNLMVV